MSISVPEIAHISKRMFCWPIALCTHVVHLLWPCLYRFFFVIFGHLTSLLFVFSLPLCISALPQRLLAVQGKKKANPSPSLLMLLPFLSLSLCSFIHIHIHIHSLFLFSSLFHRLFFFCLPLPSYSLSPFSVLFLVPFSGFSLPFLLSSAFFSSLLIPFSSLPLAILFNFSTS